MLQILVGSVASILIYALPATLFAFVYARIANTMSAAGTPLDLQSSVEADGGKTDSPQNLSTEEEVNAVLQRLGAYMADKPLDTPNDMRALFDGLFADVPLPDGVTTECSSQSARQQPEVLEAAILLHSLAGLRNRLLLCLGGDQGISVYYLVFSHLENKRGIIHEYNMYFFKLETGVHFFGGK